MQNAKCNMQKWHKTLASMGLLTKSIHTHNRDLWFVYVVHRSALQIVQETPFSFIWKWIIYVPIFQFTSGTCKVIMPIYSRQSKPSLLLALPPVQNQYHRWPLLNLRNQFGLNLEGLICFKLGYWHHTWLLVLLVLLLLPWFVVSSLGLLLNLYDKSQLFK